MKKCKKCELEKDESEYYDTATGSKAARCKECVKKGVRSNYRKNIEHYKKYERERATLPHRVEARCRYQKTDAFKKSRLESTRRYRVKNRKAQLAHSRVAKAVESGVLEKHESCQICNRSGLKIYAHHCDYNMPLDVMWLCSTCHREWHKNYTPLNRR